MQSGLIIIETSLSHPGLVRLRSTADPVPEGAFAQGPAADPSIRYAARFDDLDAVVLAHAAGGLILTLEANKTTHWTARAVANRLAKANVSPLGVVLSKLDGRKSYYYSRYDTYYGSYYGKDQAPEHS